jgi:hypothetical protein
MQNSIVAAEPTEAPVAPNLAQLFEEIHRIDIKRLMLLVTILKSEPDAFVGLNLTREQAQQLASLTVTEVTSLASIPVSKPLFALALNKEAFNSLKDAMNDELTLNCLLNYIGVSVNG